jgi:HEAT repeat protein
MLALLLSAGLVALGGVQAASPPDWSITGSRVERRAVSGDLETTLADLARTAPAKAWVGYVVPAVQSVCCHACGGYTRGSRHRTFDDDGFSLASDDDTLGPRRVLVVYTIERHAIARVKPYSTDCHSDAGDTPFYQLSDVAPAESIALLAKLIADDGGRIRPAVDLERMRGKRQEMLAALALHADAGADDVLERLVQAARPFELRKDAAFWLGSARGHRGATVVRTLAQHDDDEAFREHLTFVLTTTDEPASLQVLLEMARKDDSARVRRQALFWVAQKAGARAVATLRDAVDTDPEREVRKHAVFAITQLPHDQGVPLLIELARSHRDPEVRRQAMFWLGQSGDPRALAFFERVLQ